MKYKVLFIVMFTSFFEAGCSITGLSGAHDEHTCPAPQDGICITVTEAYERSLSGNTSTSESSGPSINRALDRGAVEFIDNRGGENAALTTSTMSTKEGEKVVQSRVTRAIRPAAPASGSAIRSAPRVIRLWIAPWEDSDGDLHDQTYVYLTLDTGRWLIEHKRANIRNEYTPTILQSPSAAPSAPSGSTTSESKSSTQGTSTPKPTVGSSTTN